MPINWKMGDNVTISPIQKRYISLYHNYLSDKKISVRLGVNSNQITYYRTRILGIKKKLGGSNLNEIHKRYIRIFCKYCTDRKIGLRLGISVESVAYFRSKVLGIRNRRSRIGYIVENEADIIESLQKELFALVTQAHKFPSFTFSMDHRIKLLKYHLKNANNGQINRTDFN